MEGGKEVVDEEEVGGRWRGLAQLISVPRKEGRHWKAALSRQCEKGMT